MKVSKLFILFFPITLFIGDRLIKYFAPSISVEGGFLSFGFYKNYAGAFSLPIGGALYDLLGIIIIFIFLYFYISALKKKNNLQALAYAFILLGGASNVFDRLIYGYTIDYANLFNFSFFNIADGMLLGGIILLLLINIRRVVPQNPKSQIPNPKN